MLKAFASIFNLSGRTPPYVPPPRHTPRPQDPDLAWDALPEHMREAVIARRRAWLFQAGIQDLTTAKPQTTAPPPQVKSERPRLSRNQLIYLFAVSPLCIALITVIFMLGGPGGMEFWFIVLTGLGFLILILGLGLVMGSLLALSIGIRRRDQRGTHRNSSRHPVVSSWSADSQGFKNHDRDKVHRD